MYQEGLLIVQPLFPVLLFFSQCLVHLISSAILQVTTCIQK